MAEMMFLIQFIYYLYTDPGSIFSMMGMSQINEIIDWEEIGWADPNKVEIIENFGKLPMEIASLIFSTIALGAILNMAGSKTQKHVKSDGIGMIMKFSTVSPVIKITKYHTIIKTVLSIACFLSFMYQTGMFYMAGDLYYNDNYQQTI